MDPAGPAAHATPVPGYGAPVRFEVGQSFALTQVDSLLGDGATVLDGGADVTYVSAPGELAIIVASGYRPDGSGVRSADDLVLREPFPAGVEFASAITAFARLPDGLLCLGPVRPGSLERQGGRLREVGLWFDNPLSYELLDRVRPTSPAPEPPSLGWLDLLPDDPLGAMEQFAAGWFPGTEPSREVSIVSPALGRFHRTPGNCGSVFLYPSSRTDHDRADGLVAFGQESDGVFQLLFEAAGVNPAVYYEGLGDGLVAEREPLHGFLLLFVLARAALDGPYDGLAFADAHQVRRLVEPLRRVPLRPLRWPGPRTHTYVGPGLVVQAGPTEDGSEVFEVYAGASHPAFLRPLRHLDLAWEVFNG
ncbi:hypothetical protein Areg01_74540 [Actinoplanes regularis]|nr:hypothetical protein Areg01_74540 [Actinoplanes regularis]